WDLDLLLAAKDRLFERQGEIGPQVNPSLSAGPTTGAGPPEEGIEDVFKAESRVKSAKPAVERRVDAGVAEAVVGAPLVTVAQDLVGLVDLLEAVRGARLGVPVGMVIEGKLAERTADVILRGASGDPENLVVVALACRHESDKQVGVGSETPPPPVFTPPETRLRPCPRHRRPAVHRHRAGLRRPGRKPPSRAFA